jgi:uncharacterized damage-inducible protein DinB
MKNLQKPETTEYAPFYGTYINKLPETDILTLLSEQVEEVLATCSSATEAEAEKPYAEGKWSLKELLQHMIDTERIMTYRALCFSRGERHSLPGFEENEYAENSDANRRNLSDILDEYRLNRQSTLALIKSFSPEMVLKTGNANGNPVSVRAVIWMIAGHESHHLGIIKSRYLLQEA